MLPLNILVAAIRNRQVVEIDYDPGLRTVEPHAVGYGSEGQLLMRCFQIGGASKSGRTHGWKLFLLERMRAASNGGGNFSDARPGYRRGDKAMKGGIIEEL